MPTPGKNFPGQKGFPTPNDTPEETVRRIFIVPNSDEWLGLLEGAAQVLLDEWRFYDWGALTPAEAALTWNGIVLASYTNLCQCTLPGGSKVIRLNPSTGRAEELGEDGEWGDPTGDYALPAIPPRETDAICLAATNCANVLQLLYENVSDSFNGELEAAAAYIEMADALVTLTAVAVGLITLGIGIFVLAAFGAIYAAVEFITADLWDENFTNQLVCILVSCATEDAGVVTFDYNCFRDKLYAQLNDFDLSASQLRLYGQIMFIVDSIGGADGLDQAGATTAITEADCSDCGCSFVGLDTQDYGIIANVVAEDWLATATFLDGFGYGVNIVPSGEGELFTIINIAVVEGSGNPPTAFAYRDMDTMEIVVVDTLEELAGHCTNFAATSEEVGDASYQLTLTACAC